MNSMPERKCANIFIFKDVTKSATANTSAAGNRDYEPFMTRGHWAAPKWNHAMEQKLYAAACPNHAGIGKKLGY